MGFGVAMPGWWLALAKGEGAQMTRQAAGNIDVVSWEGDGASGGGESML